MVIRDYLNCQLRADMRNYLLANGQAIAVVGINAIGDIPQETWYFDENSMAVDDGVNVMKPNILLATEPGRYLINMVQADWNMLFNKPALADVATSGSYNDLQDKITTGMGLMMSGNEVYVDDSEIMTVGAATAAIAIMESEINTKAPLTRTITVNGLTQDLSANRSWQVGNVSTDQTYSNPSWLTTLAATKITGLSTVATTGVSLTTTGTSGAATYNSTTGILNVPNYAVSAPTFNPAPARTLNTNYTISSTKNARVSYTVALTTTLSLLNLNSASRVYLEYSTNAGSTWNTINSAGTSRTLAVSISVGINETTYWNLVGEVPVNALVRLRSVVSGGGTAAWDSGIEVTY